jgi:Tfp pilus assembly protein PilN
VKNIDFLPDVYRHRQALRHSRLCWMGVGLLFALAIAGAASGQWYFRASLAAQLQVVEPLYAQAILREAELIQLEADQTSAEEMAALYIYLAYPWPKTQLLAAVAQAMPQSIQLTDLHVLEQAPPTGPVGADANHSSTEEDKKVKPTAKTLLAKLRSEHDRQQTILEICGQAPSDKDVHEYVDALCKSPLLVSASLRGLESGGVENASGSRFQIRAVVRPGYGQPGSLPAKAETAAVASGGTPVLNDISLPGGTR